MRISRKTSDEEALNALFEIKHLIEKSASTKPQVENSISKITERLEELNYKFEELKDVVIGLKKKRESTRKANIKKEIIRLLQKHKRLNSSKLGNLLGLSRVRANEYLKELEEERITRGVTINRKKFYMLHDDFLKKHGMEN